MTTGDCFLVAAELVEHAGLGALVVHGCPIGRGPENNGVAYWHAWVEVQRDGAWVVIDYANDNELICLRDDYYRIGGLAEDRVWRYTIRQKRRLLDSTQKYGPWVDGWEQIAR